MTDTGIERDPRLDAVVFFDRKLREAMKVARSRAQHPSGQCFADELEAGRRIRIEGDTQTVEAVVFGDRSVVVRTNADVWVFGVHDLVEVAE